MTCACRSSRDESYTDNVLEKQADLIRYLRERNDRLAYLVVQLKRQSNEQQTRSNLV